jgi:hypothetical protein
MTVVQEPAAGGDQDRKSKKKDKKLAVAQGSGIKAQKKSAKRSELDNSVALSNKKHKSKREKESIDSEKLVQNVDACDAGEPSPSKIAKKKAASEDGAKRKRDADAASTPVDTPKKGKFESSDSGDGKLDKAKTSLASQVPPPVLTCTSHIYACLLISSGYSHSQ